MNYWHELYWYFSVTIILLFWLAIAIAMGITYKKQDLEFYRECNTIEKLIRESAPSGIVIRRILQLSGGTFHSQMNWRVRELTKMAEIKYGINLLKQN